MHEFRFKLVDRPAGGGEFVVGICYRDVNTSSYVGGSSSSNGWGFVSNVRESITMVIVMMVVLRMVLFWRAIDDSGCDG